MGAWGEGSFDNDDASDWFYDFESDGAKAVTEAFSAVVESATDGYIELPEGANAVAAAEIVACAYGKSAAGLREDIRATCDRFAADVRAVPGIRDTTLTSISLVEAEDSELAALWEGNGRNEIWRAVLAELKARLK